MKNWPFHEKGTLIINVYTMDNRTFRYMRQKVSQIKEKNGQFITRVDFNIPFSEIDAATRQRNH